FADIGYIIRIIQLGIYRNRIGEKGIAVSMSGTGEDLVCHLSPGFKIKNKDLSLLSTRTGICCRSRAKDHKPVVLNLNNGRIGGRKTETGITKFPEKFWGLGHRDIQGKVGQVK